MEERNLRKERVGIVVSDKMDKTVVVAVRENRKHPLYKKTITRITSYAEQMQGRIDFVMYSCEANR